MQVENGIVESTTLGIEDHGIFTAWLHLTFDGSGQGFGGYALDGVAEGADERPGTAFGCDFILSILRTLQVESWEKLPGTPLRVRRDEPSGPIVGIGHFVKDRWFFPATLAEEHRKDRR